MATKTVVTLLGLTAVLAIGTGCGGAGGQAAASPRLAPDVAAGLATRAEQVAAALDAGQCDQALTAARSLQTDIAALPVAPAVRAEALAGAARLVSGISCPPPTTVAPPATQPAVPLPDAGQIEKWLKGKKKGHGDDD